MIASSFLVAARRTTAFTPAVSYRAFSRTSTLSMADASNPIVYFDMEVGGNDVGRVTFELRADVAPKTGTYLSLCSSRFCELCSSRYNTFANCGPFELDSIRQIELLEYDKKYIHLLSHYEIFL